MADMFIGGKIGIDIRPDTTGFGAELDAKLRRYASKDFSVPVRFDPDAARYRSVADGIDGSRLNVRAEIRGDDKAVRAMAAKWDAERIDIDARIDPKMDTKDLSRQLSDVRNRVSDDLKQAEDGVKRIAPVFDGMDKRFRQSLERTNRSLREQAQAARGSVPAFRDMASGSERLKVNSSDASRSFTRIRRDAGDTMGRLQEMSGHLKDMQDALLRYRPMGSYQNANGEANRLRREYQRSIDRLKKNPSVNIKVDVDGYTQAEAKLRRLVQDADRLSRKEARVRIYTDGADRLQDQLDSLRHRYMNLPDETSHSIQRTIDRMRSAAIKVGNNEDSKYTLNLDADTAEARRKIHEFQRKNDKLQMDLDLQTALASVHMAEFTRPRSVNVWANFKGTNLGKILNGMTMGATGLQGVSNEFDRLVNLFDTLDRKVPMVTFLGTALAGLASGAINVSGTIGGMGLSIVSMSKAALAAPAALGGLAAAGYGVYAAYKQAEDAFDITTTKLDGLLTKIGNTFWDQARKPLTELANDIAPTLADGLGNVAIQEGHMAAGMAEVVREANKQGQISHIIDNATRAVGRLNPGMQDLLRTILTLGDSTSDYLPRMAGWLSDLTARTSAWVEAADKTGRISQAIAEATYQGHLLKESFRSLTGILSGTFGTIAENQNGIEGLSHALENANKAVNSVRFQATLREWTAGAKEAKEEVRGSFTTIGDTAYSLRDTTRVLFQDSGKIISSTLQGASRILTASSSGIRAFADGATGGINKLTKAAGDTAPMFNNLLSMTGRLANTFGGTLGNSLKAASPLIQALASGTEAVSSAFAKLPPPVQAAIGMWMTFGRAGKGALDTVKSSMMQQILQQAQLNASMQRLGMTGANVDTSFKSVAGTWARMKVGDVGVQAQSAAAGIEAVGSASGRASGHFARFKEGASGLFQAMGGLKTLGVTAAISAVSLAVSAYSMHVANAQARQESFNSALSAAGDAAETAKNGMSKAGTAIRDAFKDNDKTGWHMWDNWQTGAKGAEDAMKKLGLSSNEVANVIEEGGPAYDQLIKNLNNTISSGTTVTQSMTGQTVVLSQQAQNATKLSEVIRQLRDNYEEAAVTLGTANGYSEEYSRSLVKQVHNTDELNRLLASDAERENMLTEARQKSCDIVEQQQNATIRAASAASEYGKTIDSLGPQIERVQRLAESGQRVWDENKNGFDYMSEAGRTASDTLTKLASDSDSYLKAMLANGAGMDEVRAKQAEMSEQFVQTAASMGVPEEAARQLSEQYMMTPSTIETEFKVKSEQAKAQLMQLAGDLLALFPKGKGIQADQAYRFVIDAITNGSMDVNQLSDTMQKLATGKHVVVVTADGSQVMLTKEQVESGLAKLDGKQWKTTLTAEDLASGKADHLIQTLKGSGLDGKTIRLLLDADDKASGKIKDVQGLAHALGLSDEDISLVLECRDNASPKLDAVRQKLKDQGLNDKQIKFIMDMIDHAGPKMDEVEKKKTKVTKGASVRIDGDTRAFQAAAYNVAATPMIDKTVRINGDAAPAKKAYEGVGSLPDVSKWLHLSGDNADATNSYATVGGFPNMFKWMFLNGDSSGANGSYGGVQSLGNILKWLFVNGDTNDANNKMNDMRNRNGSTLATAVVRINGDRSHLDNMLSGIAGQVLATAFVAVKEKRDPGHATGGRISGPGTKTSDSIPVRLSRGEMVLRASSVDRLDRMYGPGFLNTLNSSGYIPGMYAAKAVSATSRMAGAAVPSKGVGLQVEVNSRVDLQPVVDEVRSLHEELGPIIAASAPAPPGARELRRVVR